jgi:ferredoxin
MAKVPTIDYDPCIGCGHCSEVCPKVFELGDDQKSTVIGPDKCVTCNCQEAIDTCPVQAISWSE